MNASTPLVQARSIMKCQVLKKAHCLGERGFVKVMSSDASSRDASAPALIYLTSESKHRIFRSINLLKRTLLVALRLSFPDL